MSEGQLNAQVIARLDSLQQRLVQLHASLVDPDILSNQDRYREVNQELAKIEPVVQAYEQLQDWQRQLQESQQLLDNEKDADLAQMVYDEVRDLRARIQETIDTIKVLLMPTDPADDANAFVEIRAGTGGEEAGLFAVDLQRMYTLYAQAKQWRVEMVSVSEIDGGGVREVVLRIQGASVYGALKFEAGTHRVQRVPVTESQGRIHTSACTVAVLPEVAEIAAVDLNPADIRVDTYRSSGAGGQHVNTTDSAVRLTHEPTGIVVECQDERSQHKNRAKAMRLLGAKVLASKQAAAQQEQAEARRLMVGSGDRSERIRTYNFPQGRVTDHRINLTLYKLDVILSGQLDLVIDELLQADRADRLAAFQADVGGD